MFWLVQVRGASHISTPQSPRASIFPNYPNPPNSDYLTAASSSPLYPYRAEVKPYVQTKQQNKGGRRRYEISHCVAGDSRYSDFPTHTHPTHTHHPPPPKTFHHSPLYLKQSTFHYTIPRCLSHIPRKPLENQSALKRGCPKMEHFD